MKVTHSDVAGPEVECPFFVKTVISWGIWLASSVERATLDLRVVAGNQDQGA